MKRPAVNITPLERGGRVVLGGLAALTGIALLAAGPGLFAAVLELLLVAAGLDLVITGALGFCPLYHKLGYRPQSLGRQS